MLTGEMYDHSSLMNVISFILSHYDLSLMLAFKQILFPSFECSCRCLSSSIDSWLLNKAFILLLSFSLEQTQEPPFQFFVWNICWSILTGWCFSELLLLAWDISPSKMCIKNWVCGHFLALSFTHSVSLMLLSEGSRHRWSVFTAPTTDH